MEDRVGRRFGRDPPQAVAVIDVAHHGGGPEALEPRRAVHRTAHRDDAVSRSQQRRDERSTDDSGRAGNEDPQGDFPPASSDVRSVPGGFRREGGDRVFHR